jgi:hypothetical protein
MAEKGIAKRGVPKEFADRENGSKMSFWRSSPKRRDRSSISHDNLSHYLQSVRARRSREDNHPIEQYLPAASSSAFLHALVKWRGPSSLSLARHGDHLREHRSDKQRRNWIPFGVCQRTSVICSARRGSEPEGKNVHKRGR